MSETLCAYDSFLDKLSPTAGKPVVWIDWDESSTLSIMQAHCAQISISIPLHLKFFILTVFSLPPL